MWLTDSIYVGHDHCFPTGRLQRGCWRPNHWSRTHRRWILYPRRIQIRRVSSRYLTLSIQADCGRRYEFWKKQAIEYLGVEKARENRTTVYLTTAAIAEFFADVALCPLEATRIRLVSQPDFASGLVGGFGRILREEGPAAFYAGSAPLISFTQIKLIRWI